METVREFTCDRLSAGEGCEAVVTARTRYGWAKFRECVELLYGRRFPPMLKGAVYKSYVSSSILYVSEVCCLKESEIEILKSDGSMLRAMCGVQLKDRKRANVLMLMLGLNEAIHLLVMANWEGIRV